MFFSKPISALRFEDLEEFCKKFHENARVEYKSTFDDSVNDSVKRKLANVLSSFANSYGRILIIGINVPAGVPQERSKSKLNRLLSKSLPVSPLVSKTEPKNFSS
jgi:predicted HTH transcriptional regulator